MLFSKLYFVDNVYNVYKHSLNTVLKVENLKNCKQSESFSLNVNKFTSIYWIGFSELTFILLTLETSLSDLETPSKRFLEGT